MAVSPNGSHLYVANSDSGAVSVINTTTNSVTNTISVGRNPEGLTLSPDGTDVYVANYDSNTVSVIDAATNTISVGTNPTAVAVSPDGSHLYVTNRGDGHGVGDKSGPRHTGTGHSHDGSPDVSRLYVASEGNNTASRINATTNTVMTNVPVGTHPDAEAVSPDGSHIYVANTVSVITAY